MVKVIRTAVFRVTTKHGFHKLEEKTIRTVGTVFRDTKKYGFHTLHVYRNMQRL